MRKSNFIRKSISLMLATVMTFALAAPMADSKAADTTADNLYDVSEYRKDKAVTAYTYPTKEGYVFAGWYTDADYQTPLGTDVVEGNAYAKFVSGDVLKLKYQLPINASETDSNISIRFVTSVDSIQYRYVGFQVAYTEGGVAKTRDFQTKNVYSVIKGNVDGRVTMKYKPGIFDDASSYLMAITINKLPMSIYNSGLTVTAQWVTLDGTTVSGEARNLKEEKESGKALTPLTADLYVLGEDKFIATGGVGTSITGKYDKGLKTRHEGGAVTVLDGYNFGTKDFTVSCWVKIPNLSGTGTGSNSYLFGINHPEANEGFSLQMKSGGGIRMKIENNGAATSASVYTTNKWMHLVLVRENGTMKVYADGAVVKDNKGAEMTYSVTGNYGTAKLAFGAHEGWVKNYKQNDVHFDDIRVYGQALSSDEVTEIKNSKDGNVTISAEPKARVTYDGGIVANTGTDGRITARLYKVYGTDSTNQVAGKFIEYNSTTGVDGTVGGATVSNHGVGPYTVLKGYDFGANDFSLSTWFKIPASDVDVTGSETMLFGTSHINATEGFTVYLDSLSPRLKVNGVTVIKLPGTICEKGEWNNVVLTCKDNIMKLYFNDKELGSFSLADDCNFGVKDLAFGAYYGNSGNDLPGYTVYYDNIEMTMEGKKDASSTVEIAAPKVEITYAGGAIANTGTDNTLTVGAYKLDKAPNSTKFVETAEVAYTAGMGGDANGAISMKHNSGAYTVVKDYNFGTNDFTISAWFNVPTDSTDVSEGSGTYLFGNSQPDATGIGFSACLKKNQIRFRVNGNNNWPKITFEKGTWNNIVLSRDGDALELYYNGTCVYTLFISAGTDFGTADLGFGGYYGNPNYYHGNTMYFDNIQLYGDTLTGKQINQLYMSSK